MEDYFDHQTAAILLMKTGGILSMAADYFIMRETFIRYHKKERIRLTHRIVFELSLSNFWASFFGPFMSTWMVPKDSGFYQAAGNTATCTAQGFFHSLFYGLSVSMYTVLALTYCIIVKFGRRDESKSKRNLWLILGFPPIIFLLLAIIPLFDQAYNYADIACSIAEYPHGCLSENNPQCIRGSNARELKIARFSCLCVANVIIVISVCVLIKHVVSREQRMTSTDTERSNDLSINVTLQGIWYVAAFMYSWVPWNIWQWILITSGMNQMSDLSSPVLLYMISITYPMQGVANAFVFFRPQYLKFRERHSEELRLASILRALDVSVPKTLDLEWWREWRSKDSDECSVA